MISASNSSSYINSIVTLENEHPYQDLESIKSVSLEEHSPKSTIKLSSVAQPNWNKKKASQKQSEKYEKCNCCIY
jgi:hypothetical protein